MTPAKREDSLQISVTVIFAPSGLGGRKLQIRIAQEFVEQRRIAAALRRELRVFVKALAAARELRGQGVDEHVGRSRVEREYLLRLGGARKNGNVGDAAEIQRNTAQSRVAVEKIIDVGDERRALSAESHIRRPKIADSRNARAPGDHGRLSNLQSGCSWRPKVGNRASLMENGLAVAPD